VVVNLRKLCSQRNVPDILRAYLLATHYDPTWYKAWHTWALANFEVIAHMEGQTESKITDVAGDQLAVHVVQAVEGMYNPSDSCFIVNAPIHHIRILPLYIFEK
jgi:FKBP12-rapamycin complex-associated protein